MVKNFFDQFISLGIGVMAASKEQIEKVVNELVDKGEITRRESKEMVDKLIAKGDQAKKELDQTIKEKIQQALKEFDLVTMEEYRKLEERVAELEKKPE